MKNWLNSKTIWLNVVLLAVGGYMAYTGADGTAMLTLGAGLVNILLRFKTTEGITVKKVLEAIDDIQELFDEDEDSTDGADE